MKRFFLVKIVLLIFLATGLKPVHAQGDVINNVRTAIKAGSSRELVKYFNNSVEINFDGEKSSYSKAQAEFVLKDFFSKNPPEDFQYIHQGGSKEGLTYVIGKYRSGQSSFRVLIYIKKVGSEYLVNLIDFSNDS